MGRFDPRAPRPIALGRVRVWVPAAVFGAMGAGAVVGGVGQPFWPLVVTGCLLLAAAGTWAWGLRHEFDHRALVLSMLLFLLALGFLALAAPQVTPDRS